MATDLGDYGGRGAPPLEYVYLITAEGEWPVSAVADGPHAARAVEERARERGKDRVVHVWRAKVSGLVELELIPAHTVDAQLKVKVSDA